MACGIYQIKNIKNELVYIGSSKDIKRRWCCHRNELNHNKHSNMFLQEDWNVYGKDCFEFTILEECEENDRYDLEQEYINKLLPFYRNGNGYNISENSKRENEDGLKIFRNKYRTRNKFYKCSKKMVKELLLEEIEDGELYLFKDTTIDDLVENTDTVSKFVWSSIKDGTCIIEPTLGRARSVPDEIVDNMTREELDSYCDAMDTYEELRQMAMEGYMDEEDWL